MRIRFKKSLSVWSSAIHSTCTLNVSYILSFKVRPSPSKEVGFICINESSLQMMKNAYYFILKNPFVFKIFKFLSWFFDHIGKRLDKKAKVDFKFYDVTSWLTNNITIHILPNTSSIVTRLLFLVNMPQGTDEICSVNRKHEKHLF